ncbi:MAG: DUF354 domain-containing protein [candidate division WOR-3 bacterium]
MIKKKTIWFDFENAPHVWVLKPIYDYFNEKGYECICSARNFSYTIDLLKNAGIKADTQGFIVSKNKLIKIISTFMRVCKLVYLYKRRKIDLAISHGSRTQILAAKILRVPVISMDDYEKSDQLLVKFVERLIVPEVIDKSTWGKYQNKIVSYPGLKEHIYLCNFPKPRAILKRLELNNDRVIIVLRPEAPTSHYYDRKSTELLWCILKYLIQFKNIIIILFPRNKSQAKKITHFFDKWRVNYTLPSPKFYSFEIVSIADLVIGGGGTMLREAASLGIPTYSYFTGPWGDVDKYLLKEGYLAKIESEEDIKKIVIKKKNRNLCRVNSATKEFVINYLENYLACQTG